jgi:hypothetical protein
MSSLTFATGNKEDIFGGFKLTEETKSAGRPKESVSLGALAQPKLV